MRTVAERPILFSAEMVRAILAGWKTQTRRVVSCLDASHATAWRFHDGLWHPCADQLSRGILDPVGPGIRCPYGAPGDRLWVREAWAISRIWDQSRPSEMPLDDSDRIPTWWRADGVSEESWANRGRWRQSIHMPRWASRITLEITDVRVQRLQDISEEDALAEGTPCWVCGRTIDGLSENDCECFHSRRAVGSYQALWDSINGKRPGCSWADNPWVWIIHFRMV